MQNICIIIPCYNEANRLELPIFRDYFLQHKRIDFIFVNDGSKDQTKLKLEELKQGFEGQVNILSLPENKGKAEAVRKGMLQAVAHNRYDYIGYFDADLATPLTEIDYFLYVCHQSFKHKIIIGSRIKRMGANVQRSPLRHYFGRIFSTFASLALGLPIYDTQCGAKFFHRSLVTPLCSSPFLSRWLFDVELFARAKHELGITNIYKETLEIPLSTWIEKGDSRIKLTDLILAPWQLWLIYRHYKNVYPSKKGGTSSKEKNTSMINNGRIN